MKQLIQHLWRFNKTEIIAKSKAHCHAINLHSIMLVDVPGSRIRLFYARPDHTLWRNLPETCADGLSVGFHPHHCALTLAVVKGKITNWIVAETPFRGMPVTKFKFNSPLRGQEGRFEAVKETRVTTQAAGLYEVNTGGSFVMSASALHTVYVQKGIAAAWFVFEGTEAKDYEPVCYSNDRLGSISIGHLYKPIGETSCEEILIDAGLI